MQYRKLGRTGLDVGVVGLGAEYLEHESKETVVSVVSEAMDSGVNYIDLWMASPGVRDNVGAALEGRREKMLIAGHLGSALKNGQFDRTRDQATCLHYFEDLLTRLKTDHVDILMMFFVDDQDPANPVFNAEGLLELAQQLKQQGKARYIGMSSHKASVSLMAVNSGSIDVLMFPINPAFDMLPENVELMEMWKEQPYKQLEASEHQPVFARRELYHACAQRNVGLVAMKPYASGWLFNKKNPSSIVLTPAQCLSYSLSQPGVCTVVPGCKSVSQMRDALAYLNASEEEKDYSQAISETKWNFRGVCMYCNHCLPCPAKIDIGQTTQLADSAASGITESLRSSYSAMAHKASECLQCGSCTERCPFGVDVIPNMERAASVFEKI